MHSKMIGLACVWMGYDDLCLWHAFPVCQHFKMLLRPLLQAVKPEQSTNQLIGSHVSTLHNLLCSITVGKQSS